MTNSTTFVDKQTLITADWLNDINRGHYEDVVSVKDFGAVGDYDPTAETGTDDTAAFKAAITAAYDAGRALFVPAGKYLISSTLYMPLGFHMYGEGHTIFTTISSSRLYQAEGMNANLIGVVAFNVTTKKIDDPASNDAIHTLMACFQFHDIDLRGYTGSAVLGTPNTSGSGIAFVDRLGNKVGAQDQTKIYDTCIKLMPQNGIYLPKGAIPIHIRDIRVTENEEYGIKIVSDVGYTTSIHLDNISGDDNHSGLILLSGCDATGNVVLTNIKSENRNSTYQHRVVVCLDCDRTSITMNGGHNTGNSTLSLSPRDFFYILGDGVPVITWNGYAPRTFVGNTDIETSHVIADIPSGRRIHSSERIGSYNELSAKRYPISDDTIENGTGQNATLDMVTAEAVDTLYDGDIVACAQMEDMADVFSGEALFTGEAAGQDVYFRRQNKSVSDFTYTDSMLQGFRVPKSWTKASGVSAAFDPPKITAIGNTTTTITVAGAALGDFCLITHPVVQASTIVTSYVSAANTVTANWATAAGTRDVGAADLTAYIIREEKLNYIGQYNVTVTSSLGSNNQDVHEFTLEGAAIGDVVLTALSADAQGMSINAYVSAANTVRVIFFNLTGGNISLGSLTIRLGILNN